MSDIMRRLREEANGNQWGGSMGTLLREAADEIEALRRFLEIALDVYDDHFGATDAEKHPKNWDVQARKRLE